jgi:Transglutaminase-like superfamily
MTTSGKTVRRGPADWLMALEALALLVIFRVCLALVSVRRIIKAITPNRGETTPDENEIVSERDLDVARKVEWAVAAAARHSFVEFVCFPQTLTGYTLLRWRGVPSTMVYGVARSPDGELIAHTWLEVGAKVVTGGDGAAKFTPVDRWR